MELQGKTAIVTGGARGIGWSIARELACAGACVVIGARSEDEIEGAVERLRADGRRALGIRVDVSEPASVQTLVERALAAFGRIDVLVNNAGIQGPIGPLAENDPIEWMQTVRVNLVGVFLCCRAVLPGMMAQRSGKIINLSGGGATAARPRFSAYAVTKAAVVRLTETLAEEVKEYNIRVNAIAPGAVNTRMLQETLKAGELAGAAAMEEARRQLQTGGTAPDSAAALVRYLASEASGSLTGKLISALHDSWREWSASDIDSLMSSAWLNLRRLDEHTLKGIRGKVEQKCASES